MTESSEYAGLTEEEVRAETELLEGVPFFNIGALLLPPIWGPAHGAWMTILWYPVWLFADNVFYAAWKHPEPLSIVLAILTFVVLLVATMLFARIMQPRALHRAIDKRGKTKEQYLASEKMWAAACVILGVALLAGATYYNIVIR